jgi:hypothetical protein
VSDGPTRPGDDLYEALGVPRGATDADIKQAFRALARDLHPDRHPPEWGTLQRARAAEQWRRALSAWETLGTPATRASYDERLRMEEARRARAAAEERAAAALRAEFGKAQVARRERDAGPGRERGRAGTDFDAERANYLQAEYAIRRLQEQRDDTLAPVFATFETPRPGANLAHRVVLAERQWRDGVTLRSPIDGGLIELPRYTPPGLIVIPGRGGEGANGGPRGELHVLVEHAGPEPFTRGGAAQPAPRRLGHSFRWAAGVVTLGVLLAAAVVLAAAALLRLWGVYAG